MQDLLRASTQQFGFCSSTAFSVWHFVPTPRYAADSHSPFLILRFALGLKPCAESVFFPADFSHGIHYHFIHMVAWGHQVHIRGSSAVCSSAQAIGFSNSVSGATESVSGRSEEDNGTTALIQASFRSGVGQSDLSAESLRSLKLVYACLWLVRVRLWLEVKWQKVRGQ